MHDPLIRFQAPSLKGALYFVSFSLLLLIHFLLSGHLSLFLGVMTSLVLVCMFFSHKLIDRLDHVFEFLNRVFGKLFLIVMFYLVVVPFGFIMKRTRSSILDEYQFDSEHDDSKSYWEDTSDSPNECDFDRQF